MTDPETIIFNECMNDTPCIHLYRSAETGQWQAFGFSAYLLEQTARELCVSRITEYSMRLMMPSVTLPASEIRRIAAISRPDETGADGHIVLHPRMRIDRDNYLSWAKALREVKRE